MRDIVSDAIEMSKGQELFYLIPLTKIAEEFYLKIFNKLTEKTKKKVSSFEDLKKLSLSEKDIVATTNIIVLLEGQGLGTKEASELAVCTSRFKMANRIELDLNLNKIGSVGITAIAEKCLAQAKGISTISLALE